MGISSPTRRGIPLSLPHPFARPMGRLVAAGVLTFSLAALVLVGAAPQPAAAQGVFYAYATASTTGLTACPDTTDTSQECTLAEALGLVGPGGTVALVTPGTAADYTGNWTLATAGTSAAAPVTIAPAPGVADPTLYGNGGNASGCQTTTCNGVVLFIGTGVYTDVQDVTIWGADDASSDYPPAGYGGGIYNDGALTVAGSTLADNDATYSGGAIENDGTLTVSATTLSFNGNTGGFGTGSFINRGCHHQRRHAHRVGVLVLR